MKKALLLVLALSIVFGAIYADTMIPGPQRPTADVAQGSIKTRTREVPQYTFTVEPIALMTSYWDYMVGSYNGLPLQVVPESAGGGFFMSYTGQRQPTSQRRAFYAYINNAGQIISNNEITNVVNREGYSSVAVCPVSGKPLYAWHANHDDDAELEVEFTSDAFLDGIAGLFNDITVALDNPRTINAPSGGMSQDNEFIWPTNVVGPSPIPGKMRIYIANRNYVTHTSAPSENVAIAYADFDGDDIEMGTPLTWNIVTIPEMDDWNHDSINFRRPFHAIAADMNGNLYYAGYHQALDSEDNAIDEPDMDVFINDNYGEGVWRRVSGYSKLASWNPANYFENDSNVPYADDEIFWSIGNSSHLNAIVDSEGNVQISGIWSLSNAGGYYYPAIQVVKQFVFNTQTEEFEVREIYPQSANPDDYYQPWDVVEPWGDEDEVVDGVPSMELIYPFPYWDESVHDAAMYFHYSNVKISESNDEHMMVAVWQDSARARWFNSFQETEYSDFANTPEIYMSVTPDNGRTWSEPIVLNNVETPEFAGIKPMWIYPANKVKFTGMQNENKVGKIALMFMDDNTWGSVSITPSVHPNNDGGRIMFTELEVVFPVGVDVVSNPSNTVTPVAQMLLQNYPNPFNPETTITFNLPTAGNANLAIYNVKGQLVKNLANSQMNAGSHKLTWNGTDNNGRNVTSGIYFYKLSHNGTTETRKMMLMK